MGLIKLPDVPDELHKRLKAEAASYGITLVMYCIGKLGGTLPTPLAANKDAGTQTVQVRLPERWPINDSNKIHSCSECRAIGGHQKWCKAQK
jgi:hypothetical protein